jgi:hypothetical protein
MSKLFFPHSRTALIISVIAFVGITSAQATPLTFGLSGTFGHAYGGPLNDGTFSGTYSLATLPITPPNTGTSYEYLTSFDVVLKKGNTTVEFTPGLNGSGAYYSAAYESANGGDFLDFYDSHNDTFTLYFASGFKGVGNAILTTSKNYVSAVSVGGSANSNYSNLTSAVSFAPEPATDLSLGLSLIGLAVYGKRRRNRASSLESKQ